MKKDDKIKLLESEIARMDMHNQLAPFPIFDSEHVKLMKDELRELKQTVDNEPVEACGTCKSLYLVNEDKTHVVCMRCGSVNDVIKYDNIDEYLKTNDKKWE